MSVFLNYIIKSWVEVSSKVEWPKSDYLYRLSVIVVISSVVFSVLFGLLDFGIKYFLQYLMF